MPENHFKNRDEDSRWPSRLDIGDIVLIIEKDKQGSRDINDLVKGTIIRKLSKSDRYENGAKVEIVLHPDDWRYKELGAKNFIGRVQYTLQHKSGAEIH